MIYSVVIKHFTLESLPEDREDISMSIKRAYFVFMPCFHSQHGALAHIQD